MADLEMHGYTYDQWMSRATERAQRDWDEYHELREAFEAVQNKDHWKGPIDAVIEADRQLVTYRAIANYAGHKGMKFYPLEDGRVRVTAPGYWANGF